MTDDQIIRRAAELMKNNPRLRAAFTEMVTGRNLHTVRLTAARDQSLATLRKQRKLIERLADGDDMAYRRELIAGLACFALAEMSASDIDAQIGGDGQ